jgi:hypothetical protein
MTNRLDHQNTDCGQNICDQVDLQQTDHIQENIGDQSRLLVA